jgi:hypothetical protein
MQYDNLPENTDIFKSSSLPGETIHYIHKSPVIQKMKQNNSQLMSNYNVFGPNDDQIAASRIQVDLLEKTLWQTFHSLSNEMILTKAGGRTFPLIKTDIYGLEPQTIYTVEIEFQLADNHKYRFVNGEWRTSNRTDLVGKIRESQSVFYTHPDSPNFGSHWMSNHITFNKLKLTNNEQKKSNDLVFLKSLHKYQPIIHVYKLIDKTKYRLQSFSFAETQFIAVTAYQNEQITSLKIKYNPFAKAFLDTKPICIESETKKLIPEKPRIKIDEKKELQAYHEQTQSHQFQNDTTRPDNFNMYGNQNVVNTQFFYPNNYYGTYDYASFYNPYQGYQQQTFSLPLQFHYPSTHQENLSVDTASFNAKRSTHFSSLHNNRSSSCTANLKKFNNSHDYQSNLEIQQFIDQQKLNADFAAMTPPIMKKDDLDSYFQHQQSHSRLSLNGTTDSGIYSPTLSGLQHCSDNSANDS